MTWVFAAIAATLVVAVALVVVGRVTAELSASPPQSYFDLDEAVEFVADHLSEETTAQLSFGDVEALIGWQLDYLAEKGVTTELRGEQAPASGPLLADDAEAAAYVIGRAADRGLDVTDEQVVEVLEVTSAYLGAIGAIGDAVESDGSPADGPAVDPSDPAA